ncbi:GDP-mannose 4,6-dehydratase [Roseibium sp.]|uniref:GDP-mannose 4,6-dehydratase n=1 Tax=Roseibium sp. TaxID=1936156 RepID=UPI0032994096
MTGADGFTGRFVKAALRERGLDCISWSADLSDPEAIEREVRATEFDHVIHLAAKAFVDTVDWEGFYHVNQIGTFRLLNSVAKYRPGARCLLASSAQVYGPGAAGLIEESSNTNPGNHYAISKFAMEQGAALWGDKLEIVVARPFNYTGVGQSTDYLLPKIVDHFRRGAPVIELGNTWVQRDFGDVRAVAEAYAGLISVKKVTALVNIATGRVWAIDEVLEILANLAGYEIEVQVNPAFVRPNDVPVLGGDISRLCEILPDWQPCNLAETLRWMYLS